jgi:hypothetical protein
MVLTLLRDKNIFLTKIIFAFFFIIYKMPPQLFNAPIIKPTSRETYVEKEVFQSKECEPVVYTLESKIVEDYHNKIVLKAGDRSSCILWKKPAPQLEKYIFACPLLGKYSTVYISRGSIFIKQLISCFLVFGGQSRGNS